MERRCKNEPERGKVVIRNIAKVLAKKLGKIT